MNQTMGTGTTELVTDTNIMIAPSTQSLAATLPSKAQTLLLRMFRDPYLLEKEARSELVTQLRECIAVHPQVSEIRVLLGMALCVNFEVQAAIEELNEGVRLAPNSYIAHLKMGELWMRLRVCDKAEEHTRQAGLLARNLVQSELARRQAGLIRTMKREGIERGGYKSPWTWVTNLRRTFTRARRESSVALDVS